MPDDSASALQQLVDAVLRTRKYSTISADLVARLGAAELAKGRRWKDALKATKSKLHQVAGAYQTANIDYPRLADEVAGHAPNSQALREFCLQAMRLHASTRERIHILDHFYQQIFSRTDKIGTVLDLACGLNPLARPWMPLANEAQYLACDIYQDQVDFLNRFLFATNTPGRAWVCDLLSNPSLPTADLTFLLKSIPCLEQVDKSAVIRLLATLDTPQIVISYPLQSIGGRGKGMLATYRSHFHALSRALDWTFEELVFDTELVYFGTR